MPAAPPDAASRLVSTPSDAGSESLQNVPGAVPAGISSLSDTLPTPVLADVERASAPAHGAQRNRRPPSPEALQARRERAAERVALRARWLRASQHRVDPGLPFDVDTIAQATNCHACGRNLAVGARVVRVVDPAGNVIQLCRTCGRQAILTWSDQRRAEATAARQLAHDLADRPLPVAVA
jgi:hypothetical protein